jgi:hypothetical protein
MMRQRHPRESRSIFYENIDVFLLIDAITREDREDRAPSRARPS